MTILTIMTMIVLIFKILLLLLVIIIIMMMLMMTIIVFGKMITIKMIRIPQENDRNVMMMWETEDFQELQTRKNVRVLSWTLRLPFTV